jgi:hypothetical protein
VRICGKRWDIENIFFMGYTFSWPINAAWKRITVALMTCFYVC